MTIPQLRAYVGQQQGLPASFDGSIDAYRNLSAAQQVTLTRGVVDYIKNHPGEFTPAQVQTANVEAGRQSDIEDTGNNFSVFWTELGDQAFAVGNSVASIGQGVTNSLNLAGALLPVALLVAVFVFAYPHIKNSTQ